MPFRFPHFATSSTRAVAPPPFQFFYPGPLIDAELELIPPDAAWIDDVLTSCAHPLTLRDAPADASTTRRKLLDFLSLAPGGHQPADPNRAYLPAYHFWMRLQVPRGNPPVAIAGGIGLRIGCTKEIELY